MTSNEDFLNNIKLLIKKIYELLLDNKFYFVGAIIWLITCLVLVYLTYDKYLKPLMSEHKLNKEFVASNNNNDENITILLFKTDWCPYCQKCLPEWNEFKTYIGNLDIDYAIFCEEVDGDNEKVKTEKYNIKGYPTVKLIYKHKVYDFDARVTKNNLIEFLNSIK